MANLQSSKKRIRQNQKRRARNRHYQAAARTHVKNVRRLLEEGQIAEAEEAAVIAYRTLDKAARKSIVHRRNAARRKGRLMAAIARAKQEAAAG